MNRFVVIVLDGFGMGAMNDSLVRPGDEKACTIGSILEDFPDLKLPVLESLGLMNAYGHESPCMKFNPHANWGRSALMHFGADTFMGHQEIMGTRPARPVNMPFQEKIDEVRAHLEKKGYLVETIERQGLRYLLVEHFVTVADNLEADLGMVYNVTAPLDDIPFEKEVEIARAVREVVTVSRVIPFGGTGNSMSDLLAAEEVREGRFIGIQSSKSKSYDQGYRCLHLGYGVDKSVQAPTLLGNEGIDVTLIGKVADIVENDSGTSISSVPTEEVFDHTVDAIKRMKKGFICTNVQETDLAGHSQSTDRYRKILEISDRRLANVISLLDTNDVLLVMADHGNDPKIGHNKHTREHVPLLAYRKGLQDVKLGTRDTLSDVGATVCDYFKVRAPQNGTSFLNLIEQ